MVMDSALGSRDEHLVPLSEALQNPSTPVVSLMRLVDSPEFGDLLQNEPLEQPEGFDSQTRLSTEDVGQLVDEYRAGTTVYELQARYGVHRNTVSAHLKQCGVNVGKQPLSESEIARARALHSEGLSLNAIGRTMGRDPKTVKNALT